MEVGKAQPHEIADSARISRFADLEHSVRGSRLIIGANALIDSFVKVKFAGGAGDIRIGANSEINAGCVLYSGNGITIGDGVLVAANCVFAATNHAFARRDVFIREQRFQPSRGGVFVDDDVWIGAGCILLDGTRIGRGAVIGANALVRGDVPAYAVMAGSPARQIGVRGAD